MSAWACVAALGKAKNLKGGLLAYPREGLPFLLEVGMEVTFVPPLLRTPRSGRVVQIAPQGKDVYLVQFDTIDTIELAERLQDHYCLVRRSDLPADWDARLLDLVGYTLVSPEGSALGTVMACEENPAHPLLVVERAHADAAACAGSSPSAEGASTARIPLVEDFVVAIDEDAETITMALPEGLFDL